MRVDRLDHLVLTVANLDATRHFYTRVCGMADLELDNGRRALAFGEQQINLHQWGNPVEPKATLATPGSADLCFVVHAQPQEIIATLQGAGVKIIAGPQQRFGASGPMVSVYCRDPDRNLVAFACYQPDIYGSS